MVVDNPGSVKKKVQRNTAQCRHRFVIYEKAFDFSAGMENRLSMYAPDWVQHHGDSSAKLTQRDWDSHRTAIQELYFVDKHPLKKVRTIMAERHGFHAT